MEGRSIVFHKKCNQKLQRWDKYVLQDKNKIIVEDILIVYVFLIRYYVCLVIPQLCMEEILQIS